VEVKIELQKQHQRRITARERVDYLMDEGSFEEIKIHTVRLISECKRVVLLVMVLKGRTSLQCYQFTLCHGSMAEL
jgi:hypothetical protein